MKEIKVNLVSRREHCSQIVTGLLMLQKNSDKYRVKIEDKTASNIGAQNDFSIVEVIYCGKRIIYDLEDGYWPTKLMKEYIDSCDYYFKRSFSEQRNEQLFTAEEIAKLYPLGLNYYVTCKGNPYILFHKSWKSYIKRILGAKSDAYFTPAKFEGHMQYKESNINIIFMTRLWETVEGREESVNAEREYINETRVGIIRRLRKEYGDSFYGGVNNTRLAQKLCPELIIPKIYTERAHYLELLHKSDICIGSMGLHQSIGWKTAEYVASAKAIVNEKLHYSLPGDFKNGVNYMEFESVDECLNNVAYLTENPRELYEMKLQNMKYYYDYMRPEVMVKRTLDIIENT